MTKLTYLGHACFTVEDERSKIIIDPFLTGNPLAKISSKDVKVNAVLVSHGHGDHLGDAVEIAKRCNAPIIAPYELADYCSKRGAQIHPMHIGGGRKFDWGEVKLTIAHHGSAIVGETVTYTGNPCGFIIKMSGKTVYHPGDTGLFMDMKLIGEMNQIDVALLPIGDNFTMGIADAVKAVEFLRPKVAIPMHFDTMDVIKQDPQEFARGVKNLPVKAVILKVGDQYVI